jgi:hypothetical protein
MPSQHAKQAQNPDRSNVRFNSDLLVISFMKTAAKENATAACAFCSAKIPYGQSVCADCMKKYNIRTFDMDSDGCGCDK